MNGWKQLPLAQLGRIVTGRTPPSSNMEMFGGSIPFITPSDIDGENREVRTERFVTAEWGQQQERIALPPRSICVVCIGATIGKVCMTSEPSQSNQQINTIIVNEDRFDPLFVYYRVRLLRDELRQRAAGSATPIINKSAFSDLVIEAPALPVQRRIGSILGAYDDLIEVNRRRIAVLEELARRLFEEWFVHFRFPGHQRHKMVTTSVGSLPEGWRRTTLGAVSENLDRHRKPLSKIQREAMRGPYPYYGAAKVFDYISSYLFEGLHLLVAEDGSVITEAGHPVLQLATGCFWVNNHTHVLRGREGISTEFLYLALLRYPVRGHVTGAAQPKITQANLNRIPVVVGDAELMVRFNQSAESLLGLRLCLERSNDRLAASRDLLLPRLITGKLSVAEVQRQLEDAA